MKIYSLPNFVDARAETYPVREDQMRNLIELHRVLRCLCVIMWTVTLRVWKTNKTKQNFCDLFLHSWCFVPCPAVATIKLSILSQNVTLIFFILSSLATVVLFCYFTECENLRHFFLSSMATFVLFHCFTRRENLMDFFGPDVATITLFCCFIECEYSHIRHYNCHSRTCMEMTKDSWLYTLRSDSISVTFPAVIYTKRW